MNSACIILINKWDVVKNLEERNSAVVDDEVETIRSFDPDTQRSIEQIDKVELLPAKEFNFTKQGIDLFRNKLINISQNISHFGFSLLILSILFNNIFSSEIITNMKIGEVYKKDKIEINFQKIEQKKEKNFNSIIGTFNITDSENKSITLKPQLRIFNQPNIITSEADIKTTLFSDKFMVMNVVQNQEYFNIRYQIKPFMIWIWISVIIITLGGLVSFYRKI